MLVMVNSVLPLRTIVNLGDCISLLHVSMHWFEKNVASSELFVEAVSSEAEIVLFFIVLESNTKISVLFVSAYILADSPLIFPDIFSELVFVKFNSVNSIVVLSLNVLLM